MTVIRLGKHTFRTYNTTVGASYLWYMKNGAFILKRSDIPKAMRGSHLDEEMRKNSLFQLKAYTDIHAQLWFDQGYLMGSQV
jgi:hypothetical protein